MKQSISLLRIFLLAGLALTGCQQEVITELSDSGLLISLSDNQLEVTRSTPAELGKPLATQFNVKIEKNDGQVIYDDTFTEEPIPASAGRYTLTATCGENPVLAWDAPYYKGTATAEVGKGLAKVTIPCTVANALLSISFVNREVFDGVYSAYGVKVENGNQTLLITADLSTQSTYFQAGSTPKVTFEGTLKDGAQAVSLDLTENLQAHLPLQAGDHAKIALRASNTTLKVEKVEVMKETIQETIPSDWLPKPKVDGFADGTTTLHYVETNDAVPAAIEFTAPTPIQDAEFTLNLEDEHLKQLNGTYQLSTLTEEQRTLLTNSGITLPTLQTRKGTLDLTQLTANLQTNAGVTTRNKVSLRIKSNDRWSAEQGTATEYTIETVKPEFTVSVQPGNIWTKEFTVDALKAEQVKTGNFSKISQNIQYQYSIDQIKWESISPSLRQDQLTVGGKYFIRALYREAVPSEILSIGLCPATPLPHGDMELWTTNSKKLMPGANFFKKVTIESHNPNNATWACVNQKTFEGSPNVFSTYNLAPSTYKETGVTGYAAALRTVGWDNGLGNTTNIIRHIAAGKLFVGQYSFTHKSGPESYNYGIEYQSRPTKYSFFYKYKPYNNDSYKTWIVLENRNGDVVTRIGEGELTDSNSVDNFTRKEVEITYNNMELPITHMYIVFSSSAACSENEGTETSNLGGMVSEGDYHHGSVLVIDDVELIYDK